MADKKQWKQVGKMPEIQKSLTWEVVNDIFLKNFVKIHKFEASSFGLEFQASVPKFRRGLD